MSDLKDHGGALYVLDIEADTEANDKYRVTPWTGKHLQMTLMSIPVGGDIGLEVHEKNDQFLRLEAGRGRVVAGPSKEKATPQGEVGPGHAVLVPPGTWHNVVNIGDEPMRLYALYGPPNHKPGTVHDTKADAEADPDEK